MGQPNGEGAQSGTDEDLENGAQSGDGSGGDSGSGERTGSDGGAETVSKDDYDKLMNRLRAADQRASRAEAEKKQLADKDLPELDKLKREHSEALQQVEKLQADLRQQRLENAFLSSNSVEWENPKRALQLADMSAVDIDDDGNVTGLDAALKALAKSDPYLVKKTKKSEEDGNSGAKPFTASGGGANTKSGSEGSRQDQNKILARFPAMKGRV